MKVLIINKRKFTSVNYNNFWRIRAFRVEEVFPIVLNIANESNRSIRIVK